ncbi:MAG: AraC family transcriptional regulator [Clostridia bacterium]|nr:AraC family transcriptional regulator [Clostridia bacterium]
MDINVAYLHNKIADIHDEHEPLIITACGFYRFKNTPIFKTHRPKGRTDYQFLYITAGKAHFTINGQTHALPSGSAVLFRPGDPQMYYYLQEEKAEVYWVHFTGSDVENILESYHFSRGKTLFSVGDSQSIRQLLENLIHELQLCRVCYEKLSTVLFQQILLLAQRKIQENAQDNVTAQSFNEIEKSAQFFEKNYNKSINVEAYAESINMSVCWFIRRFKEIMKVTPMQYIISLRMSNAKTLLETRSYNVAQVAYLVGYDNPLYFSRLFTKFVGVSPKTYQRLFDK